MAKEQVRKPKQQRAIEKKMRIIKAATEFFANKGYEKSSIVEIANKADVSVGIVYSYFKDKKGLFLAMLENYSKYEGEKLYDLFNKYSVKSDDIENTIKTFIDIMIRYHRENKQIQKDVDILRKNDNQIDQYCTLVENEIFKKIIMFFKEKEYNIKNPYEKINIVYLLVENLCHQRNIHQRSKVDFEELREETTKIIIDLLYIKKGGGDY